MAEPVVERFAGAGDSIVYQDVWRGAVWYAGALTVVHESVDLVVAYRAPGAVGFRQPRPEGVAAGQGILAALEQPTVPRIPTVWHTNRRLLLMRPGDEHAVSLFWRDADDAFLGWYVDLLAPIRRTAIGIASMDLILDIVVAPDLSSWQWKDEDDFNEAGRRALFTPELMSRVRANAEKCVADLAAGVWPYNEEWPAWRPDPGWPLPSMPAGWEQVW